MSFSVLEGNPGYHVKFSSRVFLGSSCLWYLSKTLLTLMTLTILRSTGQICWRMFLSCSVSDVFFMVRLVLHIWGRKVMELMCPFHHIISRVHTIPVTVDHFDHLAGVVFHWLLFSPFPYCPLWKEVTVWGPHIRNGRYIPPLLGHIIHIHHLEFCTGHLLFCLI